MKYFRLILICGLLYSLLSAQPLCAENFYSQISRTVIRLEHYEKTMQEGSKKVIWKNKSDGTGFFVRYGDDLYVVSVRHVVERPYDLHARVECLNFETGEKERLLLKLPRKEWVFHPLKADKETYFVDVAAMKISWPEDKNLMYFRYEPETGVGKALNQLPLEDPNPPMNVLAFGFPLNIGFELAEQRPLGRAGIISMKTGKKFLKLAFPSGKRFAEERCYLVDLEAFPGNSGSPILNHNSIFYNPQLVGILSAANPSLDFAVVEPVSRIRETLDLALKEEKKEMKFWSSVKKLDN